MVPVPVPATDAALSSPDLNGEAVPIPVEPPRRRLRFWLLVLGGLGLILVAVMASIQFWPPESAPGSKETTPTTPQGPKETFCFGLVDFQNGTMSLAPLQLGRVAEVLVKENQQVPAKAVLMRLEDRQARARVLAAQEGVKAAEALVDQAGKLPLRLRHQREQQEAVVEVAQLKVKQAQEALANKRHLASIKQAPEAEVKIAEDEVKQLEAMARGERARLAELQMQDPANELRKAQAELGTARANLDQAQQALEDCAVVAPRAGVVLRLFAAVGDVVGEGIKKPAVLFGPSGPRVIRAEVDQEFARGLQEGQRAEVQDDIHPGHVWTGKVQFVSGWYLQRREVMDEMLQTRDTRTLECLIALDPDQPPLRIGQRMRVTIKHGGGSTD